jgi:hypothetical protein
LTITYAHATSPLLGYRSCGTKTIIGTSAIRIGQFCDDDYHNERRLASASVS